MRSVRIWTVIIGALALAGSCFAPIEDKPADKNFHDELSQSQLEQLQGGSMGVETPSGVPNWDKTTPTATTRGDDKAASILGSAASNSSAANQSLAQAQNDLESGAAKKSGFGQTLFYAGIFLLLGILGVVGVRTYLDKAVPDAPGGKF